MHLCAHGHVGKVHQRAPAADVLGTAAADAAAMAVMAAAGVSAIEDVAAVALQELSLL